MKPRAPLVSVVIPCYNAELYVGEAIESALSQSYERKEIIAIDDGSTDSSLDVIRSFGDRIVWRADDNRGACYARNRGLSLANGEYVKFLDADDLLVEGALETQVLQMREIAGAPGSECIAVFGDEITVDAEGEIIGRSNFRLLRASEDPLAYMMSDNPQTSLPLHRRTLLEEVGGFHEQLDRFQDYDLHMRLCLAGVRLQYASAEVTRVRVHDSESRITNQNHAKIHPRERLNRIRRREHLIRGNDEEKLLSDRIRTILARDAWRGGRAVLRNGNPEAAQEYFEYARALHADKCVAGSSNAYRWSVRVVGPFVAEHLATWARHFR